MFQKVIDQKTAYWLGFLAADGWLGTRDKCVGLALKSEDLYHLQAFARMMKVQTIHYRQTCDCYQSVLYDKYQYDNLLRLGLLPQKSKIDKLKIFNKVPKKLIHHFVRGWFDGDGSVSFSKMTRQCKLSIVGTYGNMQQLKTIIQKIPYVSKNTKIYKNKTIFEIKWVGNQATKTISNWLYRDATIFLKRKKDRIDSIVVNPQRIINKSSKFRGVSWKKQTKKWVASIKVKGKAIRLGGFMSEQSAARQYNDAIDRFCLNPIRKNNL